MKRKKTAADSTAVDFLEACFTSEMPFTFKIERQPGESDASARAILRAISDLLLKSWEKVPGRAQSTLRELYCLPIGEVSSANCTVKVHRDRETWNADVSDGGPCELLYFPWEQKGIAHAFIGLLDETPERQLEHTMGALESCVCYSLETLRGQREDSYLHLTDIMDHYNTTPFQIMKKPKVADRMRKDILANMVYLVELMSHLAPVSSKRQKEIEMEMHA